MTLDFLHVTLVALAVVMFWVGYRLRVWDSGDLRTLAATAVSESLEHTQKASRSAGLQKNSKELRDLMSRIIVLEGNDAKRQESISRLRDDISNLQGRVTDLEEKKDPLGDLTDKLVPLVEQLSKAP